jgi:hypothetical protein
MATPPPGPGSHPDSHAAVRRDDEFSHAATDGRVAATTDVIRGKRD